MSNMSKKTAFLFPGQGAQYVGMCKDFYDTFPEVKQLFDQADAAVRYKLSDIIFNGPIDTLTETRHSQPAIFLCSIAILTVIKKYFPSLSPFCCAGLSLGEYSAACAAGFLPFESMLNLVQMRAQLMHQACETHKGTMAVVLGMSDEAAVNLVKEINLPTDLWAANFNCPGQVVLSGTSKGIEAVLAVAKNKGAKRALPLQVHGAFHSGLMEEAGILLAPYLDKALFTEGICPLVSNVSAEPIRDITLLKETLKKQVTKPVLWRKGIENMESQGVELYLEIGCGKVLSGLNKRIGVLGTTISIEKVEDLEKLRIHLEKEGI